MYDITPDDRGGCTVTESWTDHRPNALVTIGRVTGVDDRVAFTRGMLDTTLQQLKATAEADR